ncbi:hypothetical protein [Aquimarina megaterium]|uniref:hypothetical protein n=1 Tax=Aquimarina megaterium TaxID=1443666 RepID=UPI0019D34A09|nr:hypothetical protein [Aquimarina megaterium]
METKPIFLLIIVLIFTSFENQIEDYVCKPCELSCDELTFSKPGICPHCKMKLIKKSDLEKKLVLNEINIQNGSGEFLIDGGNQNKDKTIKVFYHKPKNYQPESQILIVVPGAGRNGDSYRDAWISASEKYGILILSPMYSEKEFGFGAYHMCGLMYDLNLKNNIEYVKNSNIVKLKEDGFTFKVNSNPEKWIFNDFDRIFDLVVDALGATQTQYDLFGHSAGGQILHRMAIFQQNSKANRILASNSGFYTLPDFESELPFGIKNTKLTEQDLKSSFRKKLILCIGELDNEHEKGGTLLRSVSADKQGKHRLERGKFFFNEAKTKAKKMNLEFNWELKITPNIGHNHRKMGASAAEFLYKKQ